MRNVGSDETFFNAKLESVFWTAFAADVRKFFITFGEDLIVVFSGFYISREVVSFVAYVIRKLWSIDFLYAS